MELDRLKHLAGMQLNEDKRSDFTTTANKDAFMSELNSKAARAGGITVHVSAKRVPGGDHIYTWNFMTEDAK
jgi:hypothetical protein